MKKHLLRIFVFAGVFFFVLPKPAHAYLDPGTGSYVIQMVAAGFFGGAYFVATGWKKIKAFFSRLISRKDKKHSENDGE